jgi:conjugative relaxase-like TrwC/TraI family protein
MLRVTTLHASSAAATARYYAQYLVAAPGEVPGVWSGRQADGLGLSGAVEVDALELLLSGRDPTTGTPLGRELLDRYTSDGRLIQAVSGFDATFSAPKSLSVWSALTGDRRLLEAHDVAVTAALAHLERFGSTTRIRSNGGRVHPDTNGLTMATFRQTTSRADDPQIHTHAVISAKVQTADGRWYALDARYLKRHQRMLGGLYQSVLRAELTHRFGVDWQRIVNGQAEIAGIPDELLAVFSKRTVDIDVALADKLDDFRHREGREPSRWERAALTREASADTRSRKSGHGAADLTSRWQTEAAAAGWTADLLEAAIVAAAPQPSSRPVTVADVSDAVSQQRSSWGRADVVQAICDLQRPVSHMSGQRWAATLERAADRVLEHLVDLDPPGETSRRTSDGRSVWLEPTAPRFTSEQVLAQEEVVVVWAMAAQADPAAPSTTVDRVGLDAWQGDAAASVAGHDPLVLVVGPAGAGKTRMLTAAADDLHRHGRVVFAVAPTAGAARTVERDTGIRADTAAKLLHEWQRTDRLPLPEYRLPAGATLIVDEAGMLSTPDLHRLVTLADRHRWRLALVGDSHQLQGVGRGGLLAELCRNGRVDELEQLHRFTHRWEAAASLLLRVGDPRALDAYEARGRIVAGTLDEHLHAIVLDWLEHHREGRSLAVVASTNDHVDVINRAVQDLRRTVGDVHSNTATPIAAGEWACIGDVVATRRNDRRLVTSAGEPVRNRDTWTVTTRHADGSITVSHHGEHGTVTLPADYVREHVRLGYAATEHGWQSATVDTAISLVSPATTRRGLYVATTRGADENLIRVITDSNDVAEARDVLEAVLAVDRADIPAVTQRRNLARQLQEHVETIPSVPRYVIPEWFPTVLAETRRALADAEAREAHQATRRAQATVKANNADAIVADVAAATSDDRDALRHAEARAVDARRRLANAEHRLDTAPRRQRRSLRHDADIAQQQLDRAESYLARTRQRTAPAIEQHARAVADQRTAHEAVRRCDTADRLDAMCPTADHQRRRLHALTTWQHWAHGDTIADRDLHTAYTVLAHQPGVEQHLAHTLRPHLPDTTIHRNQSPYEQTHIAEMPVPELDLGIDL